MVSFRDRLAKGLGVRGISVSYQLNDTPYDAVLVIGGTHQLVGLWRAKQGGVPIIQRLDGINWIHRKTETGVRHYLRAEYGNLILSLIRARLADRIIYQSEFAHQWWERVYGKSATPWHVVYNGVDLENYTPQGKGEIPNDHVRILLVEGTIGGGYEIGLRTAIQMGEKLSTIIPQDVEVMVVGRIAKAFQPKRRETKRIAINFMGQVAAERIPELDRSAHVLYAADLQPACPNSVVEALACGLPVTGFNTGALAEIVTKSCGVLVPYGADPWKLEPPDINSLAHAVSHILIDQASYRNAARKRAEEAFSMERMVEGYLEVLNL